MSELIWAHAITNKNLLKIGLDTRLTRSFVASVTAEIRDLNPNLDCQVVTDHSAAIALIPRNKIIEF